MASELQRKLAQQILNELTKEFDGKQLTGNLLKTVRIDELNDSIEIHITAPTYDFYEYFINGVIVPPQKGGMPASYADSLDSYGSEFTLYWMEHAKTRSGKTAPGRGNIKKKKMIPRNHIGYVNRTITNGLNNWIRTEDLDVKVEIK